jgi:uncharacterized protein YodC (DUF2158 family)
MKRKSVENEHLNHRDLQPGDLVRLKRGGPTLMVSGVSGDCGGDDQNGRYHSCYWVYCGDQRFNLDDLVKMN